MTAYRDTVRSLDQNIENRLDNQVLDEDRADYGGYFSESHGFASPSHIGTSNFLRDLGYSYLIEESQFYEDETVLDRIRLAAEFQQRCQRSSGLIDIPQTNFESPPDTAFSVSQLAPVARLARESEAARAGEIENDLRPYLVSASEGIVGDGFHTPNHRWVIVSALSQVDELYPREAFREEIDAYLAEGIDINDDGEYSERSTGGYNAVVNRHLICAAEALDRPKLLEPVRRNLHTMVDLMHDDWTVVTSFSRRSDQGRRSVPTKATDSFYYMARRDDDERLRAVAHELLDRGGAGPSLLQHFDRHPEWRESPLQPAALDTSFTREMDDSGVWRVRNDKLSATLATETSNAFEVTYGDAVLTGVRVHAPYFAGAKFEGEDIEFQDGGATLRLESEFLLEQLPGYWKPVGEPVGFEELPYENLERRDVAERPEFDVFLEVERDGNEFDVTVRTEGGMSQVPFVVECRFANPDRVELDGASVPATLEDPIYLQDGSLCVRTDGDAITVDGGFFSHRKTSIPEADDAGDVLSVMMTDWSPLDRSFSVRCHEWSSTDDERTADGPASNFEI